MTSREEFEQLSSKDLHDRAVRLAEHRLDVAFLWRILKSIPAAEASIGETDEAEADIAGSTSMIHEFMRADEGELADALRPLYVDYLEEHEK